MKRLMAMVCALALVSCVSFAEDAPPVEKIIRFTGTVDSVFADKAKPKITLRDKNGIGTVFGLAADAVIIDENGKPTTLTWLSRGQKVLIEYVIGQYGRKIARSITVEPL